VVSALLSGAMAVGTLGAVFGPATGTPAVAAHPAAVRTVAYSTPLEPARPAGIVRKASADGSGDDSSGGSDGSGNACVQGGGLTICGKPASSNNGGSSGGTTKTASTGSATGSDYDESDDPIKLVSKMFIQGAGAVSDVAKAATAGFTAASDVSKAATAAMPFVGPLIAAAAPLVGPALSAIAAL
jgi:hypothetical protein